MVFSLADFDDLHLPSSTRSTTPIPPNSPGTQQISPSSPEPIGGPANQQLSSLSTPAIDPVLLTISPRPPDHGTGPMLHGEDLTQLARHLILQKSLSKNNADELVSFAKRPLGEQLVWIAATQLSLNESVLAVFCGEVSPTLLKHVKQEVSKRILSPNLPAYKNEQLGFELIRDALLVDQNSDISEDALKDIDFCKKVKSAILNAWTKARNAVKTEIVQSLGDDPAAECNADGLPNRRPSSTGIAALSMNVLQSVPSAKGIKFSVPLAARIAFLRYCYTMSKDTGRDYWGLVDKKLEEIRGTVKDPSAITQKFTKILSVDQCMYGTADEANKELANSTPSARRASGSAAVAGSKRKRS